MYKIQELIKKGLQIEKLPADIQDDIATLKTITRDFTVDDPDGHDYDNVIYEVIMGAHGDLIPAGEPGEPAQPVDEPEPEPEPELVLEGNPLIGDKYFSDHPEKVLGKQTLGGRYGSAIIVTGDKDSLNVDVPSVPKVFVKFSGSSAVSKESKENIIAGVEQVIENRKNIRREKKREVKKQISAEQAKEPEFYTFREISEIYNKDISREEMEAFLYANPILPWNKYIDEYKFKKEELVKNGFLFYENGQFIYKWQYLSGDINRKVTLTKRDEGTIREQFGDAVYENQISMLHNAMPQQAQINIDTEAPNRINLSPISEFAKTFLVKDEELAFTADKSGREYSLNYWFVLYLRDLQQSEPEAFKGSEFKYVRMYVQDERIIVLQAGGDASADEKKLAEKANMTARQKAKTVAERLFDRFMFEELFTEAKMRVEILWNEKYNAFKLPDLAKMPVGFSLSKFIKSSHLKLNITQRESVAFINYNRSGCLALEVGLGKTLSALASISQAVENNLATHPLIVSPKNVYWKWQKETEGYFDDELNRQIVGVLHHYPKVLMLGNCNEKSVINAKDYTHEEKEAINKSFKNIELAAEQIRHIIKYLSFNDDFFITSKNPLADMARQAKEFAELYVQDKVDKLFKKYEPQLKKNQFNEAVIAKLTRQLNELIAKEREKLYDTFARIYRRMAKEQYSYLVYMTGKFKNTEKGTITIVTEEALKGNKIGCRDYEMIINRMYGILSGGDIVRKETENNQYSTSAQGDSGMTAVEKAGMYEKIRARVEARLGNAKVALEDLGIDMIVIDEAHHAKKIFPSLVGQVKKDDTGKPIDEIKTSKSGESKLSVEREKLEYSLGSGETSGIALSAFILATYIQETTKTGNVILLTATPFENDPLEIYSMLTLSNYPKLVQMGYESMKEFFDTFMRIEYDFKIKLNGVEKSMILNGFQNLVQFRNIVRSIILHRTGEQAKVDRPDKIIIPYLNRGLLPESIKEVRAMLMPTTEQTDLIKKIELFIAGAVSLTDLQLEQTEKYMIEQTIQEQEELEKAASKEDGGEEDMEGEIITDIPAFESKKSVDVIDVTLQTESEQKGTRLIQAFNLIRQITLSPYALKLSKDAHILPTMDQLIESSPKLQFIMACVKSVKEYHEKKKTDVSGQIIYSVVGKDFFPLMRQYLIERVGFKPDEVAIIHGGVTDKEKEKRKTMFYEGKIKVLIASKSIQVGADLNKNSTVMYHLFYDWNPTDNEQINGRIWRQGNRYGAVRIVYPMVENSVDPVVFQYLGEKTMRIKDVWDIAGVKSQLDLSEFDPNKMKLAALTDPVKKATFQIELEKETIKDEITFLQSKLDKVAEIPATIREFYSYVDAAVKRIGTFFALLRDYRLNELKDKRAQNIEDLTGQKDEVFKPIQELIDKRDEEIAKMNHTIQELEAEKATLDEQVKSQQAEIKIKISDASVEDDDEAVKKLKTQYKDIERNFKTAREKEIKAKQAEMEKAIKATEARFKPKIDALQKKLDEKLKAIEARISKVETEYTKNVQETSREMDEKIFKADNRDSHGSFKEFLTYLSYQATSIVKWCRDSESEGRFSDQMSDIYYQRTYYIGDLEQFKNYKGQYEKIKLAYLDPMGIAEEDAANLPMAIRKELEDKRVELEAIGEKFHELVRQYTIDYQTRLANAKTPQEESEGFSMLNFLLDEMVDVEEAQPLKIEAEPEVKTGKKKAPVPTMSDVEYLETKIEIFEMALETADGETKDYLETKIEIFKDALSDVTAESTMQVAAISRFAEGGRIIMGDVKSITSYVDLVSEGLMTPKQFIKFMRTKGLHILPNDVFKQIEDVTNYNKMIEIFEYNEII